jgi:eukaryotic-like serine/threonine-protein kinase
VPAPTGTRGGGVKKSRLGSKVPVPIALVIVALSIGGYVYFHRTPKLTDKDTIVLADFTNTTGDPVFDDTLKTGLNVSLRQSPFLNVLSESDVTKIHLWNDWWALSVASVWTT